MPTTRRDGLASIRTRLGNLPLGPIATSKYYPIGESWAKAPAWWFDVPLDKLKDPKGHLHLLCRKIHGGGFDYLSVPISFILNNLSALEVVEREEKEVLRLHLSARNEDKFHDLRGPGKLDFSVWFKNE